MPQRLEFQEPRVGSSQITPSNSSEICSAPDLGPLPRVWGNISTRKPFAEGSTGPASMNVIYHFLFLMLKEGVTLFFFLFQSTVVCSLNGLIIMRELGC